MRVRKKKWSDEVFAQHKDILVNDFKNIKGCWKNTLHTNKLRLEIGAGKGDYWIGLGKMYPDDGVIALEKDYTVSSIALRKLEGYGKKRFIYGDAKNLDEIFEKGELDVIHLNFSDPWPKKRHAKRRLTYDEKIKHYETLLSKEGEIWMKTDNQSLFEYSLQSFSRFDFELSYVSFNFRKQDEVEDPFTEYERKFMEKGQRIYRAVWRKKNVE